MWEFKLRWIKWILFVDDDDNDDDYERIYLQQKAISQSRISS